MNHIKEIRILVALFVLVILLLIGLPSHSFGMESTILPILENLVP